MNMPSSDKNRKNRVTRGRHYEQKAALFYEQQGFEIIEKNWRTAHKEIDLIVQKDSLLVFVEVKSSTSKKFGHPAERVDRAKIKNLTEAARQFLIDNKIENCDLRFDVVTFSGDRLEHYPNAFESE
ncbi:MAG: YraN family protein [candidate division Zixibacteria bacterium]|nr:YraN family protein [candidate division Zixibacteria bacterium]